MTIKSQSGITLVELLGSLAILSIILILIGSVHLFGQRQFVNQTDAIDKQAETRRAISQLTEDIRSVSSDEVWIDGSMVTIGLNVYEHEAKTLHRNERILSEEIEIFLLDLTEDGIEITIASTENKNGHRSSVETALYFRK